MPTWETRTRDAVMFAREHNDCTRGSGEVMAAEHLVAGTDAAFGLEVEQHKGLAIVDFWATGGGPCHMVTPILDQLAREDHGKPKGTKEGGDAHQKKAKRLNERPIS